MSDTPPEPKSKTADEAERKPADGYRRPGFVSDDQKYALDVYQAIAWVQDELTAVGKNRKQTGDGPKFLFRGIDDVYNALHPLLGQAGLIISGQAESFHTEDHYWSKGKPKERIVSKAVVMVRFRVFASDGSKLPKSLCPLVPAEGVDDSDKGSGKAWSYAYKTAISSMFSLPTDDPAHDNEQHLQPASDSYWWDLWPTKASHDDFRSENMSLMRKLKTTRPEELEEIKQWMQSMGLMDDTGRVIDKVAREAMTAWSDRLSLAVSPAESSDADSSDEPLPAEATLAGDEGKNLHESVLSALGEHGPMTEAEIAEEIKTPAQSVRAAVMGLSMMKSIEQDEEFWALVAGEEDE